ncbi:Uncharacterised protein g3012 [Pycnogonum litorale]
MDWTTFISLILSFSVVNFGVTFGTDETCRCALRLIGQNDEILYSDNGLIRTMEMLSECDSPTAQEECCNKCNEVEKYVNYEWTEMNANGQLLGDFACLHVFVNCNNGTMQNFYDLCGKNKWQKGNFKSNPISCKDGKMIS